jgi:hypothetical protein
MPRYDSQAAATIPAVTMVALTAVPAPRAAGSPTAARTSAGATTFMTAFVLEEWTRTGIVIRRPWMPGERSIVNTVATARAP